MVGGCRCHCLGGAGCKNPTAHAPYVAGGRGQGMKGSGCPSFGEPQNNYIRGSCLGKRPGGQSKKGTAGDAAPADVSSKRAKTEHGDGTASAAEERHQAELLKQLEKLQGKKKMLLLQVGDVQKEEKALLIEIASDVACGSMSA